MLGLAPVPGGTTPQATYQPTGAYGRGARLLVDDGVGSSSGHRRAATVRGDRGTRHRARRGAPPPRRRASGDREDSDARHRRPRATGRRSPAPSRGRAARHRSLVRATRSSELKSAKRRASSSDARRRGRNGVTSSTSQPDARSRRMPSPRRAASASGSAPSFTRSLPPTSTETRSALQLDRSRDLVGDDVLDPPAAHGEVRVPQPGAARAARARSARRAGPPSRGTRPRPFSTRR